MTRDTYAELPPYLTLLPFLSYLTPPDTKEGVPPTLWQKELPYIQRLHRPLVCSKAVLGQSACSVCVARLEEHGVVHFQFSGRVATEGGRWLYGISGKDA